METAPPNKALVCVPSTAVINSQNVLPLSAEHSLSTLSIIHPSDTPNEEITASILFENMSPVPKTPRKYSIEETATTFFITEEAIFIYEKRKEQRGNKVEEQRYRRYKQPKYFRSTKSADTE